MKDSGPINTTVISSRKFTWLIIILLVGGALLMLFLGLLLDMPFIGVGFVFFFAPLVFEKRMRKPFCKNAKVQFFEDYFSVTISDIDSGDIEYADQNKYSEIEAFITTSNLKNDFYSLRIYFKDGSNTKYTFCDTKYSNTPYVGQGVYLPKSRVLNTNISSIFFQYAKEYNATHADNAITIHPTYFATSESRVVVIIVSVFIAIAIAMVSYSKPAALPVCLIPVFFFYVIVISSKSSYKSDMKNLSQA